VAGEELTPGASIDIAVFPADGGCRLYDAATVG